MSNGRKGHVPQRTCIVCGSGKAKTALLRLVVDAQNRVRLDRRQRRYGRGAYVCLRADCLARVKQRQLQKAFRRLLPETAWDPTVALLEALQSHEAWVHEETNPAERSRVDLRVQSE
jgi:hypothetical protein